jgi:predicted nucleic acid-binding protein
MSQMSQVVDANLAVALVLLTPYSAQAQALWEHWSAKVTDVFAPDLWAYEVTSALRKAVSITGMPSPDAEVHLETVMRLGVQLVPPTLELDRVALRWAPTMLITWPWPKRWGAISGPPTVGWPMRQALRSGGCTGSASRDPHLSSCYPFLITSGR